MRIIMKCLLAFLFWGVTQGFVTQRSISGSPFRFAAVTSSQKHADATWFQVQGKSSLASSVAIPDPNPYLKYPSPPKKAFSFMPLRQLWRFVQVYFLGLLMFTVMFTVNTITASLFVFLKFWMRKIQMRRYGGFNTAYSLPPLVELQFDFGRMLSYVPYLTAATDAFFQFKHKMHTADELVGPTIVPSDEQFISQVILRSPMAFYTTNTEKTLITNMTYLNDVDTYDNTYYEVTQIDIDKATSKITIHTKNDGAVTKDSVDESTWTRAKMHALNCIGYFIPGIGHSWVHFNMMDAVSATVHNNLDRKSILYSLLEPHTRYTNRINWEALGVQGNLVFGGSALVRMAAEATSTAPRGIPASPLVKKFEPWAPFPMPGGEFVRNNAKRTTEYYFRSGTFSCPPSWLNSAESEIPYIRSLKRFYPIVRKHVEKVLSYESDSTIEQFLDDVDAASTVDGNTLGLKRFDPVDAITSIIFDAVFIHSTDHYFTYEILGAARYGIGTIRHPFKRWWFPGMNVPSDMLDDEDRVRWNGFSNVFVKWNDSKIFSNGMKSLKYKFRRNRKELKDAAKDFVKAIEDEHVALKKAGEAFCPMEHLARSICW